MENNNHITKERYNYRLLKHAVEYFDRGMELMKQALEREAKLVRNGDNNKENNNG